MQHTCLATRHWGLSTEQHNHNECPGGGSASVGKAGVRPTERLRSESEGAELQMSSDRDSSDLGVSQGLPEQEPEKLSPERQVGIN